MSLYCLLFLRYVAIIATSGVYKAVPLIHRFSVKPGYAMSTNHKFLLRARPFYFFFHSSELWLPLAIVSPFVVLLVRISLFVLLEAKEHELYSRQGLLTQFFLHHDGAVHRLYCRRCPPRLLLDLHVTPKLGLGQSDRFVDERRGLGSVASELDPSFSIVLKLMFPLNQLSGLVVEGSP